MQQKEKKKRPFISRVRTGIHKPTTTEKSKKAYTRKVKHKNKEFDG